MKRLILYIGVNPGWVEVIHRFRGGFVVGVRTQESWGTNKISYSIM